MPKQMSEDEIYEQAKKRVEEKKGFFIHLTVYIAVKEDDWLAVGVTVFSIAEPLAIRQEENVGIL